MTWTERLIDWAFPMVFSSVFMWLIYLAVRRSQRLNASHTEFEGKRALMMLPNRAALAVMTFGIFLFGSCLAA